MTGAQAGDDPTRSRQNLGRWPVRLLAVAGSLLVALAGMGWWLDTRVIDDQGFADVVAKASQRRAVRSYVADQATLRLARTSNFVSGARPVVTDLVATAIATPPVEEAVREFAARAHDQVFRTSQQRLVDIDAQQAQTAIRSALETINPSLARKLPANVLDASATISQSPTVDTLFTIGAWIWLWIPIGLLGIALLLLAIVKARDRVHALRAVGIVMAVSGALLVGFGAGSPVIGAIGSDTDPGRADAIGAFVEVLTGRLVGFGYGLVLIGLAIALAPGSDGGDLPDRWARVRAWAARRRASRRWRFAGGIGLVLVAAWVLTNPGDAGGALLDITCIGGIYVGIVVALRAGGLLVTDHTIPRLKKRHLAGVLGAMVLATIITAGGAIGVVAATQTTPKANPREQGCNGYVELCLQPVNQVVWPASHNAMSSSAYNFFGAEHTITIPEQLNAGARFLMLDVYYGYDDNGIVRTNLAGGVNREALAKQRGPDAVHALDRLGALTGTADTSGKKQDLYFCHDFCELGAVKAVDVLSQIKQFLDRNLTEVVMLDFEDYVQPADVKKVLVAAGLFDRVLTFTPETLQQKTLLQLVTPKNGADDQPRRLMVMSEQHGGVYPWLPKAYSVMEETPYTFSKTSDFTCAPNRGGTGRSMFLVNHWLRPDGPPDPTEAAQVNSTNTLTDRFENCITVRDRLPTVFAVDFTAIGNFYKTINRFNGAVARLTGATHFADRAIARARAQGKLTDAQVAQIDGIQRLPNVSEADARKLLGPVAGRLRPPPQLTELELQNGLAPSTPVAGAAPPATAPNG